MSAIYGYNYNFTTNDQKINLPQGAKVINSILQNGQPKLYAIVDTTAKEVSRTISAHKISIDDSQILTLAKGAEAISLVVLNGEISQMVLFTIADTNNSEILENRIFSLRGTGNPMTGDEGTFIETLNLMNGRLILHGFIK